MKEALKLIKGYEKDFVWYCKDRVELECKTTTQAKDLLNDCTADWDWENLCREQGFLEWLRVMHRFYSTKLETNGKL